MVEGVGDDGVLLAEERLEEAAVGVETGAVKDRVVRPEEAGDGGLEVLVHVLRTANESHGRHTESALLHGACGGLDEARIVG